MQAQVVQQAEANARVSARILRRDFAQRRAARRCSGGSPAQGVPELRFLTYRFPPLFRRHGDLLGDSPTIPGDCLPPAFQSPGPIRGFRTGLMVILKCLIGSRCAYFRTIEARLKRRETGKCSLYLNRDTRSAGPAATAPAVRCGIPSTGRRAPARPPSRRARPCAASSDRSSRSPAVRCRRLRW